MKKIFLIITIVGIIASSTYAQYGSAGSVDARAMGLAKTYNATSNGVYSIGINPSNLMFKADHTIDFSTVLPLPTLSIKGGTDFMSLDDLNYFFGGVNGQGRYLSQADKDRLNSLFDNGGLVFANVSLNLLSVSYKVNDEVGAFGFSINDQVEGQFIFPRALADLGLSGNTAGKTYDFSDANANAWWLRDYSLTYARSFKDFLPQGFGDFNAGLSLKIVQGFAYVTSEQVNTTLQTSSDYTITGDANFKAFSAFSEDLGVQYKFDSTDSGSNGGPFPTPAGSGFGFDLGFSTTYQNVWRFAFAITDIGSVNWTTHTAHFTGTGNIKLDDIADQAQRDSLKNKLVGVQTPGGELSSSLPTALRLGASYFFDEVHNPIPGTLLLAADYNQGFNDQPGNSSQPRISLGAEWKPGNWIPYVRTGFSFGGLLGFRWAVGLGVDADIVEFNLATNDLQSLLSNSAKFVSISFGSRWKF